MKPTPHRAQQVLTMALSRPAELRLSWLREYCGTDEGLFAEVAGLLHHLERSDNPLNCPVHHYLSPADSDINPSSVTATTVGADSGTVTDPPSIPTIPGYELISELGRGGMGVVYKAKQIRLGRIVALKMLIAGAFASDDARRRFVAEAQAIAQLDHPSIVSVFEINEHAGLPYFSMAFVDGESLEELAKKRPIATKTAVEIVRKVAVATQYAHDHGVIHRDLKPANILIDSFGEPRVADFGLAKRIADAGGLTVSGQLLGTVQYMAPEQAAGKHTTVGGEADTYAIGATLYCLLTGSPPFSGSTVQEIVRKVIEDDLVPVRVRKPSVHRDLDTICQKALEKDVRRRYRTSAELADDLERFLRGENISASPLSPGRKLTRWIRRHPWSVALCFILLGSLAVGSAVTSASKRQATSLRINRANSSFASAVAAYENGHLQASEAHFAGAFADLPPDHQLRRPYLDVAWDRASQSGNARIPALEHSERILCARFSGDGSSATTVTEKYISTWSTRTGALLSRTELSAPVDVAVMSADCTKALLVTRANLVLRDMATGEERGERRLHLSEAPETAFLSPDGNIAIVKSADLIVGHDLNKGGSWTQRGVRALAFSPDSSQVTTTELGRNSSVRDARTGGVIRSIGVNPFDGDSWVEYTPAGDCIAFGGNTAISVFDARNGQRIFSDRQISRYACLSLSGGGKSVAIGRADGTVEATDLMTAVPLGPKLPHDSRVSKMIFSPNGRHIAVLTSGGGASLWDVRNGYRLIPALRHEAAVTGVVFSEDGRMVMTYCEDGRIRIWTVPPAPLEIKTDEIPTQAIFDPSSSLLVAITPNTASVYRAGTWERLAQIRRRGVRSVRFNGDGSVGLLLVDEGAEVWSMKNGRPAGFRIKVERETETSAFPMLDVSGEEIWCATPRLESPTGGTVQVLDAKTGALKRSLLKGHVSPPIAVSADRSRAILLKWNDVPTAVAVVGLETGKLVGPVLQHPEPVKSAEFDPSGTCVMTSGDDSLCVWDAASGKLVGTRMRSLGSSRSARLSRDNVLQVASRNGKVELWNPQVGERVATAFDGGFDLPFVSVDLTSRFMVTPAFKGAKSLLVWPRKADLPEMEDGEAEWFAFTNQSIVKPEPERASVAEPTVSKLWWRRASASIDHKETVRFHKSLADQYESVGSAYAAAFHLIALGRIEPAVRSESRIQKLLGMLDPADALRLAPDTDRFCIELADLGGSEKISLIDAAIECAVAGEAALGVKLVVKYAESAPLGRIGRAGGRTTLLEVEQRLAEMEPRAKKLDVFAETCRTALAEITEGRSLGAPLPTWELIYLDSKGDVIVAGVDKSKRVLATGLNSCFAIEWLESSQKLLAVNGSDLVDITDGYSSTSPKLRSFPLPVVQAAISPKGDLVSWSHQRPAGSPTLHIESLSSGEIAVLPATYDSAWASDGTTLALMQFSNSEWKLGTWEVTGKLNLFKAPFHSSLHVFPSVSLNRGVIAFGMLAGDTRQIGLARLDGKQFRQLTKIGSSNHYSSFCPDGRFVAFCTSTSGGESLNVVDVDTGSLTPIATGVGKVKATWRKAKKPVDSN